MQIFLLIALSSLTGAVLLLGGAILGYFLTTRSMDWAVSKIDDATHKRKWGGTEPKPGGAGTGSSLPRPDPPKDSGPVKLMQPEDYAREQEAPLKRRIGEIIGIKDDQKP